MKYLIILAFILIAAQFVLIKKQQKINEKAISILDRSIDGFSKCNNLLESKALNHE